MFWRVADEATMTGSHAPFDQNKQQSSKKRSPDWKWICSSQLDLLENEWNDMWSPQNLEWLL